MAGDELLTHITPAQRVEGERTAGMLRQQAIATEAMWASVAFTEPGMTSGWHHHGDHETMLYIVRGAMRLEFGPGGASVVEAGEGEFVHVPAHVIHRESNPAGETSTAVIARSGSGVVTVNVDGPAQLSES